MANRTFGKTIRKTVEVEIDVDDLDGAEDDEAVKIVRLLSRYKSPSDANGDCFYCGAIGNPEPEQSHWRDCVWRQACEHA